MKRKIPLILLCLVFLGIAGYFGTRLYQEWSEYRAGEKAYEALNQYVQPAPAPLRAEPQEEPPKEQNPEAPGLPAPEQEEPEPSQAPDDTNWPIVDFEALQAINPDIIAWICIEGTNINYPVVQGPDNSYYLHRLSDGRSNGAGSIFMDYRNEGDLADRNTVLYGHHMKNGSMFQNITKYKDPSFFEAHPVGLIMTPNGNYKLEFFAGYVTNMNSDAWKIEFSSDEEYALWLEDTISRSGFSGAVTPTAQDRVVTLSTCTYEYSDARYVLVGVLK